MTGKPFLREAEFEARIDAQVMRRLRTDDAYRNAENPDDQEAREEEIANEEISSLLHRYDVENYGYPGSDVSDAD